MKSRFDEHLSRKFYHMATGTILALYFAFVGSREHCLLLGLLVASILIPFDFLRLRKARLNEWVLKNFSGLMRENEKHKPSAQVFYILGLLFCAAFLPKTVAIQGALTLAWMDPVAAIFGVRFGKNTWNSWFTKIFVDQRKVPREWGAKTIEGSAAGFVAAFLAGVFAWTGPWASVAFEGAPLWWPSTESILVFSTVGGLAAVFAEAWPSQWDDNARVPFWTGICVWVSVWVTNTSVKF